MRRARTLAMVALGALGLGALGIGALGIGGGCQGTTYTGLEIIVTVDQGAMATLHELRVVVTSPNGFVAQDAGEVRPGVSARTDESGRFVVTYSHAGSYDFQTTPVDFQLVVPNAVGQLLTVSAEGSDDTGSLLVRTEQPESETVVAGRMLDVRLVAGCVKAECAPADGGLDLVKTADEASHFMLRGATVGTSLVQPLVQAAICYLSDPTTADLVIGVPAAAGDFAGKVNRGRVLVYRGKGRTWSGTLSLDPGQQGGPDLTIVGGENSEQIGATLACGLLDGDAYGDLVIGAPDAEGGAGRVYVYYGAGSAPRGTVYVPVPPGDGGVPDAGAEDAGVVVNGFAVLHGPEGGAHAGASLAVARLAGGRRAVVIGAPGAASDAGEVYVVPADLAPSGSRQPLGGVGVTLAGSGTMKLGAALAAGPLAAAFPGTVDDLAIGAPGATHSGAPTGAVYLVAAAQLGGADAGVLDLADLVTVWGRTNQGFSVGIGEVLAMGDLLHSGTLALAVGAPRDQFAGRDGAGAVYLLEGGASLLQATEIDLAAATAPSQLRSVLGGPTDDAFFGSRLAFSRGSPGSSYASLWVGAPGAESGAGLALYVEGASSLGRSVDTLTEGAAAFKVKGATQGDRLGAVVAAGALGADNTIDDLVVVAPNAKNGSDTVGAVYGIIDAVPK